jgi:hypothetical protein
MSTSRLIVALAVVGLLGSSEARAASFTISGGQEHVTPPDDSASGYPWLGNQVIPLTPGFLGAELLFRGHSSRLYDITFEFIGFEAAWEDNELRTTGGNISDRDPVGSVVAVRWLATGGLDRVPFSFMNGDPDGPLGVANGANRLPGFGLPNFFLSISDPLADPASDREGHVVVVALDDHGAGPDVDHDDWVGFVRAERVPEPSTLLLVGSGLLAIARRRRR